MSARDMTKILDEELPIMDRNVILGKQKAWILFSLQNQETTTTGLIALSSLCRQPTMKKPCEKYPMQEMRLLTVAASMMQAFKGAFSALEESRGATKDAMMEMLQKTNCFQ
jgi:hypothetical protein